MRPIPATSGPLDQVAERVRILGEHCAAEGRDPAEIEMTVSFPIVIRDDAAAAEGRWAELVAGNGIKDAGAVPHLLGSPELVAAAIRPYLELGFSHVIARMPAPFDRETVDRIGEVRARLEPAGARSGRGG